MPFEGFPRNVRATPVPDPIFNSLLEEIEDLAELKVTLRLIWLLGQQRGQIRYVAERNLESDSTILLALRSMGGDPRERIQQGLALAVTRGTLLRRSSEDFTERFYLLNTEENRRSLEKRSATFAPSGISPDNTDRGEQQVRSVAGVSSIYDLYEDNIGTIGPLMAEQLAEAEERYPPRWIEEAFSIAINENKRSWRYIAGILRRWAAEGRGGLEVRDEASSDPQPGIGVKAGATLWEEDGRQHGEPGRHSEKDDRSRQPRNRHRR
ncbi:MAG: DnaD domain protein [Chloroflexi bacterium]|nr:DnaD domain protein [Chloroflexota bacterium]